MTLYLPPPPKAGGSGGLVGLEEQLAGASALLPASPGVDPAAMATMDPASLALAAKDSDTDLSLRSGRIA